MPASLAPAWQHPYVDVFKLCGIDELKDVEVVGDVTEHMDRIIGKKVFKIKGTISAGNFLRLPKRKAQSLGLTGRFLYMQVKVSPVKAFVIHVEAVTADQNIHRISISSMYTQETLKRKSNGIQIPFPRSSHRWCVMALDLAGALRAFSTSPFQCLKEVQLCSWITVRALYTSDMKFALQHLPRDMALSHALDSSIFEMVWLPSEPKDVPDTDVMPTKKPLMEKSPAPRPKSSPSSTIKHHIAGEGTLQPSPMLMASPTMGPALEHQAIAASNAAAAATPIPTGSKPLPSIFLPAVGVQPVAAAAAALASALHLDTPPNTPAEPLHAPAQLQQPAGGQPCLSGGLPKPLQNGDMAVAAAHGDVLEPDPALQLQRISSFTGELPRMLIWPLTSPDEVVFGAASVIVAMKTDGTCQQRFFLGHTSHVCCIAFDAEGVVMASAQEGKIAIVRLWNFKTGQCLAILNAHAFGINCLDLSPDCRALVAVGMDAQSKQLVVVWDINPLRHGGKVEIIARHTSEYNIKCVRFSLYEEDHLVACGKDSIRFYRLKRGQLRGVSIRWSAPDKQIISYAGGMLAAMGPTIFTDIAHEAMAGIHNGAKRHVYIASASGAVFQINYDTRQLTCVYQLHSAAINSLTIHDGFCVTGSEDKQLRMWPMDFSDFLMEAEHEAAVTSVGVAPDGLRVCIGTENGAIGILDITSHEYKTLLRSHLAGITGVAGDPNRNEFCTVSSDGTIRIWDLGTHQQLYEFDAPGEAVTCVAYHPVHRELACGFQNGRIRVFDVDSIILRQEHKQHRSEVAQVLYSAEGTRLFSAGADGGLCVYNSLQAYQPIKFLFVGAKDVKACVAVSHDGRYLATSAYDQYRHITSVLVFHATTLEPYMRIETDAPAFTSLAFSPNGWEVWALTTANQLNRYELSDGRLVQQVSSIHRLDANFLTMDPMGRYLVTGGMDHLVKLWGITPRSCVQTGSIPPHQTFVGHPSAVTGAAFKGSQLITVGDYHSIYIWNAHYHSKASITSPAAAPGATASGANAAALQGPAMEIRQWQPGGLGLQPSSPHPAAFDAAAAAAQMLTAAEMPAAAQAMTGSGAAECTSVQHHSPTPTVNDAPSMLLPVSLHSSLDRPTQETTLQGSTSSSSPTAHNPQPSHMVLPVTTPAAASGKPHQHRSAHDDGSTAFPSVPSISTLVGFTPSGAQNVVWQPQTGLFAYAVDNTVVVEDLATRQQRWFSHHTQPVSCIAASPDGSLLAVASSGPDRDGAADVCLWDVGAGTKQGVLQYHPVAVQAMAFSPESAWLVSVGRDPERAVVVWSTAKLQVVAVGRTQKRVFSIAWQHHPARSLPQFLSAGQDGLLLWELHPQCLEQRPVSFGAGSAADGSAGDGRSGGSSSCTAVAADEDGAVVVADAFGTIWELQVTGSGPVVAHRVADVAGNIVTQLAVMRHDAAVATADGVVATYRRQGQAMPWQRHREVTVDSCVLALCVEASMAEAVCATSSATVWYLNLQECTRVPLVCGHQAPITSLSISASHSPHLVSTSEDGAMRIWQMDRQLEPLHELQSDVACMVAACTPDGEHVVGGYRDGTLRLYHLSSHSLVWCSNRHGASVAAICMHPSKPWMVTASSDGSIASTELRSSRLLVYVDELTNTTSPGEPLHSLAVSSGDAALCAAAWRSHLTVFATPWEDSILQIQATHTCEESPGCLSTDVPATVAFISGPGKLVAYSSPLLLGKVVLFDFRLARAVGCVAIPQMVCSLAAVPDGCLLAMGSTNGTVFLADPATGQWLQLPGRHAPVAAVACLAAGAAAGPRVVSATGTTLLLHELQSRFPTAVVKQERIKIL